VIRDHNPVLEPVGRAHTPKAELAYQALRDAIIYGRLEPGERITLVRLAQDLQMSSMPVRQALNRLANDGLVLLNPHTDILVAPLLVDELAHVFEVRGALEALAVRQAMGRMTPEALKGLWVVHADYGTAVEAEDYEQVAILNRRFHDTFVEIAANLHLARLMDYAWTHTIRCRAGVRIIPGRAQLTYEQHHAVMLAVSAKNVEEAVELMHAHVVGAVASLREHAATQTP